MGRYIGYIEKKGYEPNIFFNYKPFAEVRGENIFVLSPSEQEDLLPKSEKRNISLIYSWNNIHEREIMDNLFAEKSLAVFDFVLDDLQDNIKPTGERNPTGYKVQVMDLIDSGKICTIESLGIYYAIKKEDVLSNFSNDAIVEIDVPYIRPQYKVFIELDGFWAGAYEVGYRDYTSSYYVKPQIKENKFTVSGYSKHNILVQELISSDGYWGAPEDRWTVVVPKKDAKLEQLDMITKEALLESFRDSLQNNTTNRGILNLENIPALLNQYEESLLSGTTISEELRCSRLKQLRDILTAEADLDATLSNVTNFICDLLVRNQDDPNVEEWLKALLEKHPDLIEQLKSSRAISERVEQLEQSLDDLQQKRDDLELIIAEKKAEADEIDRAAVEAKKTELLQMDAEYTSLCDQIESAKQIMDIIISIDELQKKQSEYREEVAYLESHKNHLERDTSGLELQFQSLISKPHEKMVDIAFDGFMASKMLNAAAKWEAEETSKQHYDLVNRVNNIETNEKTPEELIDYLCNTIQKIRPFYSRNTIINIAICLSQSFLTVFSGEPGCGKTSICNIFGKVLGLNNISKCVDNVKDANRYISVSVERGWTSKRDFVGYYNPLSKTFDKSNRSVYEALHQLDTEKKNGIAKYPYVILLDEANLSPMEYYWSDFMNICDDLNSQSEVNLGEDYVFGIPETLHFVATINNDYTIEKLSPRLIDRAWVVTLPRYNPTLVDERIVDEDVIKDNIDIITWTSLSKAFIPDDKECGFSAEIQKIYDAIIAKLKEKRFFVSPRIDKAIKRYWASASKYFEMDDTKTDAQTVALDYAVAQRILPKFVGNGEAFEKWLEDFRSLCSGFGLNMSAEILRDIIERGNLQMKYYEFFC